MAYDEHLAQSVRTIVQNVADVREQRMFGGLAFLAGGHMFCGVVGEELMLRLGEQGADAALDERHTRPMDFTGRPMSTMVFIEPAGIESNEALEGWIGRALSYVQTLPPKTPKR